MNATPGMIDLRFSYSEEQRERFRNRGLSHEWFEQYPEVFDQDDLRLATGPQCRKNHFFEWLAAVQLFELTGYRSLVEKYDCRNHARKHAAFRRIVGPTVFADVMRNPAGIPDLLVYAPDRSDWFFAEVKGASDRLKPHQRSRIQELFELTGRRVLVLNFATADVLHA